MQLTEMDYVRAALANAVFSDMDLQDVFEASLCAENMEDFDEAVNLLGLTVLPYGVGCNDKKEKQNE